MSFGRAISWSLCKSLTLTAAFSFVVLLLFFTLYFFFLSFPRDQSSCVDRSLRLMLPKYTQSLRFLLIFLSCLSVSTNVSRFFHWRFFYAQLLLHSKLHRGTFLDTYKIIHGLFQTTLRLHRLEYYRDQTLYPTVTFVSVVCVLFWFSIPLCCCGTSNHVISCLWLPT